MKRQAEEVLKRSTKRLNPTAPRRTDELASVAGCTFDTPEFLWDQYEIRRKFKQRLRNRQ